MGLTTIRTSNNVEKLNEEFFSITDYHTRAMLTFTYVNRWLAVRLGKYFKINLLKLIILNLLL